MTAIIRLRIDSSMQSAVQPCRYTQNPNAGAAPIDITEARPQ